MNRRVRKINSSGVVSTIAGKGDLGYVNGKAATAQFKYILHAEADLEGNAYVIDNSRVRKITMASIVSTLATIGEPDASLPSESAAGLATDAEGTVM